MKYPKRSQYKYVKSRYRIRNWPQYEVGLRRRVDLTVWLSDAALVAWRVLSLRKRQCGRVFRHTRGASGAGFTAC